MVMHIAKRFSK